jgi:hypothetical protein
MSFEEWSIHSEVLLQNCHIAISIGEHVTVNPLTS